MYSVVSEIPKRLAEYTRHLSRFRWMQSSGQGHFRVWVAEQSWQL